MRSKWFGLKPKAIKLRQRGTSLRSVEKILGIPKSTLSGWFRNVPLTKSQKLVLKRNHQIALSKAREKATAWHNQQKDNRIREAEESAAKLLSMADLKNPAISELALAMLYLGEGLKTRSGTGIGNSDPLILKFFVNVLLKIYKININKIKCSLHLRADQDPEAMKRYWSKELHIPVENFTSPSIDLRTKGKATYSTYFGVCVVQCGNISLQRKLLYISRKFCESIID